MLYAMFIVIAFDKVVFLTHKISKFSSAVEHSVNNLIIIIIIDNELPIR